MSHNGPILVDAAAVTALSDQMQELKDEINSVLQRYEEVVNHTHQSGGFTGGAGIAHVTTTAQIKEAQDHTNARFEMINQLLRSGAQTYTQGDEDNRSQVLSLGNQTSLRWT
ncbi:WXG100 family type VII secretion target [Mycobacterium intracellulare]|uniref:WXG100 family type VII secretion target n=1 Tax=Mycobacterium intracellulare TaxID=1767 RepID=UPI0006CA7D1D|nr:WXG100 family type VII secretion target [Mycobacterium intracellulare]KPN47691.1 hypothetical protein AN933_24030 [Mycobacterium intracellulare subsp. chimaera]